MTLEQWSMGIQCPRLLRCPPRNRAAKALRQECFLHLRVRPGSSTLTNAGCAVDGPRSFQSRPFFLEGRVLPRLWNASSHRPPLRSRPWWVSMGPCTPWRTCREGQLVLGPPCPPPTGLRAVACSYLPARAAEFVCQAVLGGFVRLEEVWRFGGYTCEN